MNHSRSRTTHIVVHRSERPVEASVEYHYYVRRDGGLLFCLPEEAKGSHARNYNGCSIGVAVEGCFCSGIKARNKTVTLEQYARLTQLLPLLMNRYSIPLPRVLRHSDLGIEGTRDASKLMPATACPGDLFPWAMLMRDLSGLSRPLA